MTPTPPPEIIEATVKQVLLWHFFKEFKKDSRFL
jgi:hypothetical protein